MRNSCKMCPINKCERYGENMNRKYTMIMASLMAMSLCVTAVPIKADSISVKPYIAFGADLTTDQKNIVMTQLEVTEEELADYETVEVTNEEEHKYLDSYLDSSVIGTRALSSVKIEEADAGAGVSVETHNISFCTEEMYTNALVTAGISDATVTVAAPFEISGTAALVGAMKAYGTMTGEGIDSNSADAATNELVLTGELADTIGKEEAAEFVALIKDKVVSGKLASEEDILAAIDEAAKEMNIEITEEEKQQLMTLMKKISELDLDLGKLKDQAKGIYDKIKGLDIDTEEAKGVFDGIGKFFSDLFRSIGDFFGGLFN